MRYPFFIFIFIGFLAGCEKTQGLSCTNEQVKEKVASLAYEQFLDIHDSSNSYFTDIMYSLIRRFDDSYIYSVDRDYNNVLFSIEDVRTTKQDKELGNYACKANLIAKKGENKPSTITIEYTSESVDDGKNSYIEISDLTDEDIGALSTVLIKKNKLVEKTVIGYIGGGSLTSYIGSEEGSLTFATDTPAIWNKCDVIDRCKIKALVYEDDDWNIIQKLLSVEKIPSDENQSNPEFN